MAASQQSYYGPPPAQYGPQSTGQSHWGEMVPGQSMGSSVKYNITAFARNIPKMDGLLGKADPYLVVSVGSGPSKKQIFKSEVVRNDLNPSWRPFTIDATEAGGESVPLTWEAFDWDEDGGHDFIGSFTATLQQVSQQNKFVFMNPGRKSTFGKSKPESGDFHIANCTRAIGAAKVIPRAIRFVFRGEKLAKKDIGSSDPFLVIWASPLPSASGLPADQVAAAPRPAGPRPQAIIAKTEVIQKNLNPTWQPLDIHLELTGGLEAPMTIICYDFDDDGGHDEIGRCIVSLKDLTQPDPLIPLLDPKKKASVIHPNSGVLRVTTFEEIHGPPDPKPLAFDLSISMKKLARMDFGGLGKSDPFIQISARVPSKQKEGKAVIFKSEIITQSLSPTFKPFQLTVVDCGGLDNPLTFEVFDKDPKGQELIGGFKTTLRELSITKSNVHFLTNPNHHSRYSGIVIINSCVPSSTIVPQGVFSHAYTVKCGGKTMDRSTNSFSIFAGSKSGPLLHKSNVVRDSKNPVFETFTLDTAKCDGLDGALYFEFSDPAATGGKSSFVGGFTTTLRELNMWKTSPIIPIIDPSRVGLGYKSSGDFLILDVQPAATPAHSPHDPHAASSSQWGGAPQWGAPPGGAPPPGHWGAPPGGAPPSQWGPPPGGAPPGQWSAPPSQWGPPPGGAPPGQWSAPPSQWGPPPGQWGAPPGGAPPSQWGPPPSQWGPPPSQWGPPPSQWGPPAGGPPPGQWGPPPGGAPPGSAPPGQWGPPAGGPPPPGGPAPSQWGASPAAAGAPAAGGPAPSQWGAAPPGGAPPGQWGPPPGGAPPGQWGPPAGGPPPAGSPSPSQWGPPPSGGTPPPGR